MANLHIRATSVRAVIRRVADEFLVWSLGIVCGIAGAVAGLTVVIAVYGTYGARVGIFTSLALLGLFLVAGVALVLRRQRRAVATAGLVAALRGLADVRVTVDREFGKGAVCQRCGTASAVVRVYGEPAPRHMFPLELAEVCAVDALPAARQALGEQDEFSRSPIRIEVAA